MYCGYEELEIDQKLYPAIPKIPKGDVLFLFNTGLIHNNDVQDLRRFDEILNGLFTNGELYESNKKWIVQQRRITPAERLLSVVVNICVQRQKWDWIPVKEIDQFIASKSRLFPTQLNEYQYDYLFKQGYLKLLLYDGGTTAVALQPKIVDILKFGNITFLAYS